MNKIKKYSLIILAAVVLIGIGWFVFGGNYPVSFVGFTPISAKDFNKNYAASLNYYKKAMETYLKDSKMFEADETKRELKRAVLDNLIENVLIDKELKKELKPSDLRVLIDKKMNEIFKSQTANKAVEMLYGFSYAEFKKRVLKPQAKREILEGRVTLRGENFSEKLKEIKKAAQVRIFMSGFEWENGEVAAK